jgi:hypothetical protein
MWTHIMVTDRVSGKTETLQRNVNIDAARDEALAILEDRGGLAAVRVRVASAVGGVVWRPVPRERNTGPGRYVWERERGG